MSDLLRLLAFAEARPGEDLALATIVRTGGSTYRRRGARMLIDARGAWAGVISGGCLEQDVAEHARAVLRDRVPRLLAYDTRATHGCNGVIELLVEPLPGAGGDLLRRLREQVARRETGVIATAFARAGIPPARMPSARPSFRLRGKAVRKICWPRRAPDPSRRTRAAMASSSA